MKLSNGASDRVQAHADCEGSCALSVSFSHRSHSMGRGSVGRWACFLDDRHVALAAAAPRHRLPPYLCPLPSVPFPAGLCLLERISLTTSFCLPLGLYFFLLQNPAGVVEAGPARPVFASSIATAGILLWLYGANFLIPTPVKRIFQEKAGGRSAAIKISDGPELNRSLYYTGDRQLLYTFADPSPVGTVRQYQRIETSSGQNPEPPPAGSNNSFRDPVKFQ